MPREAHTVTRPGKDLGGPGTVIPVAETWSRPQASASARKKWIGTPSSILWKAATLRTAPTARGWTPSPPSGDCAESTKRWIGRG